MIEPIRLFLTHPFGLTVVALAVILAGLLAAFMERRRAGWSAKRLVLAATLPLPLLCAIATTTLLLVSPWDDSLLEAVLLTVGLLGTAFTLIAGAISASLVVAGIRR
ncbi:hypothetical protein GGQ97_001937 [Sphingomonas kaistensis]|uniref:Uncharacterized protein n=1 Tax=Sphingomonas kaistensis TaxID=298708 RepID=A0A7X6BG68_9SPHN|nr:hypothetical protein [Sphingomonas kaistensis]NJC06144.1 hypothetical protein [Sphingomonas kaistensis]